MILCARCGKGVGRSESAYCSDCMDAMEPRAQPVAAPTVGGRTAEQLLSDLRWAGHLRADQREEIVAAAFRGAK